MAMRPHIVPIVALIIAPLATSALVLLHFASDDPAGVWSFLGAPTGSPWLTGVPGYSDAAIGLLVQPLARLSALDWLHGIVPWWNPYTGVGMPLAAEMQTMSFFLPFVLLMKWWQGWLYLRLLMQIIAGFSTYALMLELGCRRSAALVPTVLFALNGGFLIVPQAMGSMAFMPLLILGIERSARMASTGRAGGWLLIPIALAWSLYGGFPEVAYLDGLLAVTWTIARFATPRFTTESAARWRFAGKIAIGALIGLTMALPLLVPFLHYVGHTVLGMHRTIYRTLHLRHELGAVLLFPLIYGPIPAGTFAGISSHFAFDWPDLAGWFSLTPTIPALAALIQAKSSRNRALIVALGLFVAIGLARCFGLPLVTPLLNATIPDFARIDAVRFLWPALQLAVFVLAGLGLEQWRAHQHSPPRSRLLLLGIVLIAALGVLALDRGALIAWYHVAPASTRRIMLIATIAELLAGAIVLGLLSGSPTLRRGRLVALIIGIDAIAVACIPQFCAPPGFVMHRGGIGFLRRHLGTARFYAIRPFGPDYPAGYHLASIDDSQLPVARSWSRYITTRLDPATNAIMFMGWWAPGGTRTGNRELRRHLAQYEAIGVKYVVATPGNDPFQQAVTLPPKAAPAGGLTLGSGQSVLDHLAGSRKPVETLRHIAKVGIPIGTYGGRSRGRLAVRLCAGVACTSGGSGLRGAPDDAALGITLRHRLTAPPYAPLTLQITHVGPGAVVIWQRRDAQGATAPAVTLYADVPDPAIRVVYRDPAMTIYRLPTHRRFFTTHPHCAIVAHGLNRLVADCPNPAHLIRLEAWFAGWHAMIDGHRAPIGHSGAIFQTIKLPAGRSRVVFYYRPSGARLAVFVALAALVYYLIKVFWFFFTKKNSSSFT